MLFLHETHQVIGRHEDASEVAFRYEWMPTLGRDDSARLLYFLHHAHGTGVSYNVITITAIRDGAAWEGLVRRTHVYTIIAAWLVTVPCSALVAAIIFYSIRGALLP